MTMITEKCPVCGEPIDASDIDTVQVHGGERGLVHEECLLEYEDDPEAA